MATLSDPYYSVRFDDLSAMWAVVSRRARDVPLAYHARRRDAEIAARDKELRRRGHACAPVDRFPRIA
jgi:hypothetical protein